MDRDGYTNDALKITPSWNQLETASRVETALGSGIQRLLSLSDISTGEENNGDYKEQDLKTRNDALTGLINVMIKNIRRKQ